MSCLSKCPRRRYMALPMSLLFSDLHRPYMMHTLYFLFPLSHLSHVSSSVVVLPLFVLFNSDFVPTSVYSPQVSLHVHKELTLLSCRCIVQDVSSPVSLGRRSYIRTVTIDKGWLKIDYGTPEVFKDLMIECAWEACTNAIRSDCLAKCHFFRCIHYLKRDFSNKNQLNFYRWEAQCPNALDADKTKNHSCRIRTYRKGKVKCWR